MTTYADWAARFPEAAAALEQVTACNVPQTVSPGPSEAWAQQQIRMSMARQGGVAWRNNVGATKARCPDCGAPQSVVRYGLANDSAQLNARIKSSDIIGIVPRLVTPDLVGQTIGQFAAFEVKRPGWKYTGTEREQAQLAFITLVQRLGGRAEFNMGDVTL